MEKETLPAKRLKQMHEAKSLPDFEQLYFDIAADLGMLNNWMANHIGKIQGQRKYIKQSKPDGSIAALDREFEMTSEYKDQKTYKYWCEGLSKMMAGIRVKIESLRAEQKGQY